MVIPIVRNGGIRTHGAFPYLTVDPLCDVVGGWHWWCFVLVKSSVNSDCGNLSEGDSL